MLDGLDDDNTNNEEDDDEWSDDDDEYISPVTSVNDHDHYESLVRFKTYEQMFVAFHKILIYVYPF